MGGTPIPHLHSYDEGSEATNDRVRAVPAPFTDNLFNQMSSGIQAWMDWYHKTALVVLFEQSGAAEPGRPFGIRPPFLAGTSKLVGVSLKFLLRRECRS